MVFENLNYSMSDLQLFRKFYTEFNGNMAPAADLAFGGKLEALPDAGKIAWNTPLDIREICNAVLGI